ncbi:MAG TPA: hypothetical protein VNL16_02070, partial [Chloroflexota bacterium]|nr:hypothetical protein [Chloroflexota bacterium]
YLEDEIFPRRKVFIDSRPDMYGAELTDEYLQVAGARPGWRAVLDRHDVRIVLVRKGSPLALTLSGDPAWQTVYDGTVAQLFERTPR